MTPTLPSTLPDDVELLETLGAGAFGTVYVARLLDGALSRTVVLKVLKQDWSKEPEALRRARDEAAMLSRLNHDNIVRVERLTTWRGHVTVVMEHLVGMSLDQVLAQHGPLPVWSALEITSRVCSALDAAYAGVPPGETRPLRIVHRDIKPSNILLTVSGAVKVLDFGAARAEFDAREAATRSMAFGTPLYMAPECFDTGPPGPAVDIYALGATLFELLHGEPLGKLSVSPQRFWPALQARLNQVQHTDLPDGPARDATLELLSRTLRYDADRRPDAQTLRAALRELMNKQPMLRYGLDQLGETVIEPLYRRRKVLPPTPLDGTLQAPLVVLAPSPPAAGAGPPAPAKFGDDATVAIRREAAPIISRRLAAPIAAAQLGAWPPLNEAHPAPHTAGLAPHPRMARRRRSHAPYLPVKTEELEELELDVDLEEPLPAPRLGRRLALGLALFVTLGGLAAASLISDLPLPNLDALSGGAAPITEPDVAPGAQIVNPAPEAASAYAHEGQRGPTVHAPAQMIDRTPAEPSPAEPAPKPASRVTPTPPNAPPPNTAAVPSELTVKTLPAGATVSAKGLACSAPCTLTLPQGAQTVSVTFPASAAGPTMSGRCSVQLGETATLKMRRTEDAVLCE